MTFSVVIPAHNEEGQIGGCLDSVERAAKAAGAGVEIIVVLNRCTDGTEGIAAGRAVIVREEAANLSRIRNAGAARATGEVIVTIDADSRMAENMFIEVAKALESGRFIGGGVRVKAERYSVGIVSSAALVLIPFAIQGISAGSFWCRREDFRAIGGFNEEYYTAEDYDFAVRLKAYGRTRGKRFGTLWRTHIVTSCRKFDWFGDWFVWRMVLRHPWGLVEGFRGRNRKLGDRLWYDTGKYRMPAAPALRGDKGGRL
jgi:glycosyltransferase involved in cell wall biosynthesis